jgi:hypothetical protein
MTSVDLFMTWLEKRLQELVEGGSSWIIPGGRRRRELADWLAEVMRDNARRGRDGGWQAPDLFILTLPGRAAAHMEDTLLVELAAALQSKAQQEGMILLNQPVVRIVADPVGQAPRVQVSFSDLETSDTATIKVEAQISAPSKQPPSGRAYLVVEGSETFILSNPVVSIGRDGGNALVLGDMRVSRTHAHLRLIQGQYVIFDLQSTGGTTVNGRQVVQQALVPGDVISLAGVELVYGQDVFSEGEVTQQLGVETEDTEEG